MRIHPNWKGTVSCLLAVVMMGQTALTVSAAGQTLADQIQSSEEYGTSFDYTVSTDYRDYIADCEKKGYQKPSLQQAISIPAADFSAAAQNPQILSSYQGRSQVVKWTADITYLEWKVTVPQNGLYGIRMEYMAADDVMNTIIQRKLEIDGKSPFAECAKIPFRRLFEDDGKPVADTNGDEVAADVKQVFDWQWAQLQDSTTKYTEPLQFYLTKGVHTLRVSMVNSPMYLSNMELYVQQTLPDYAAVLADYRQKGYPNGTDTLTFEAEGDALGARNASSLRASANGDPAATPQQVGKTVINVVGGTSWQGGGQSLTWKFHVKTAGLYKIALRVYQKYRDGMPSYRSVAIDGQIPYSEFTAYRFAYQSNWRTEVLGDGKGNPYLVYLSAGDHTLTMAVQQASLSEATDLMEKDTLRLSQQLLKIKMLTGQNPDYNYDYELDKQIPDLIPTLKSVIENMQKGMKIVTDASQRKTSKYYQWKGMITQLQRMIDDPFIIPKRMADLEKVLTTYGEWIGEFQAHPLMVDTISVLPTQAEVAQKNANFIQKLYASVVNFNLSFVKNYNAVSSGTSASGNIKETIDVWVGRGTAWCTLLKQMTDTTFTPASGVSARINILPSGQLNSGSANALLLAISSGRAPDVALGVGTSSIGEFAMRNALVDVSKFEDFETVSSWFQKALFTPMTYQNKVYGLPETQTFLCMVYRKDLFSEMGLYIPNTWDEVYNQIIPVLNQNNMQFYVPMTTDGYGMFLYQEGGDYYKDDHVSSALDSSNAYNAFVNFTNLYTRYGVPTVANFYNRFRTGETPAGIVDFATYMTILAAAPDIAGKWGVARIPGIQTENGIDRTHSSIAAESCMIMEQSKKQASSWKFIKWWMSEKTQTLYGDKLEALLGESARWGTANWNAFTKMAFPTEDFKVIEQSFANVKVPPVVLGGYYTTRHINNAINRVVISGVNARDSLEEAVSDIDRELKRRNRK